MMSMLDLAAILLTLSALFGWLNRKFLPLPHAVGLLTMSIATSLVLSGVPTLASRHVAELRTPLRFDPPVAASRTRRLRDPGPA